MSSKLPWRLTGLDGFSTTHGYTYNGGTFTEPDPPQNVRAVMPGGSSFPIECVYRGVDENGIHRWVAVCPPPHFPVSVTVDVLPAHTSVEIEVWGD